MLNINLNIMTEEKKSANWRIPLFIGLLIGALVLTFTFQNSNEVYVKFLFWQGKAILSFTYFIVFAVTTLAVLLLGLANWWRRGKMKRKIGSLEEELEKIKAKFEDNKESKEEENEHE